MDVKTIVHTQNEDMSTLKHTNKINRAYHYARNIQLTVTYVNSLRTQKAAPRCDTLHRQLLITGNILEFTSISTASSIT
jgi:hypothetical protein